jgi:drug/metabolite transporter (DMT)-like permease
MENKKQKRKGKFYAIISGLMYSLLGYFGVSIIKEGYSVENMSFWRFFIAAIFIFIIMLPNWKKMKVDKIDAMKMLVIGAIFYGGCSMLYFVAAKYIGTGLAIVIFFTFPAFVLLINKFLYGIRITKNYIAAVGLIMVGLVLLIDLKEMKADIMGIFLSILTGILYAGYVVGGKQIQMPPLTSTFLACAGCFISAFILSVNDGSFVIPQGFDVWIDILGISIISTALPMLLLLEALRYISSTKGAILSVLEPVFMVFVGIMFLGEKISLLQGFGVCVILSGSLITLISPQSFAKYKKNLISLFN